MANATELVTKFTFEGTTQPLTNFNSSLTNTIAIAKTSALALATAGAGMFAFVSSQIDAIDTMADLSNETGVAIETIQKLGYVAQLSGSSAEAIGGTISSLTAKIGLAARGGEFEIKKLSNEFEQLGVSVKDSKGGLKTADVLLMDIQKAFSTMDLSTQEKAGFLTKLGIDKSALQMLNLTTEEMSALMKEAEGFGIVTQAQAEQAQNFNDNLDKMKMAMSSVGKQVAISFAPQMLALTDNFMGFLNTNKELIQDGLKALFNIIGGVIGAIVNTGKVIFNIIDTMIGWENALMIAGGAWLYLNRAMMMNPIGLIIAGITVAIVIIDDLATAFDGGQSAIRDFFLEWFGWDILPSLKALVAGFQSNFSFIKNILASIPPLFQTIWASIVSFFSFDWLTKGIQRVVSDLLNFFKPVIEMYNKVASIGGGQTIEMPKATQMPKAQQVQQATQLKNPTNSLSNGGNVSSSKSLTQNINIDVKTNDSKNIAPKIGGELNKYMKDSAVQFNKGGR